MNTTDPAKILFIDIETVPVVYKYDDLPENARELWNKKASQQKADPSEYYQKAGIFAEFAKVICIGMGHYFQKQLHVQCLSGSNERDLLEEFCRLLTTRFNRPGQLLCAHNGKEFDYPFLCRRLIVNGMPLPPILKIQGLKPWNVPHLDTLELWKFGDVKNFTSLSLLAHILGFPSPKDDMDGSQVGRTFYEENNLKKISDYCLKDVVTLARVYHRFSGAPDVSDEDIVYSGAAASKEYA
jgi:3'-5' exonuclease